MCQFIATALELCVGHPFAGFRHNESRLLGTRDDVLARVHAAPPLVSSLPFESLHAHLAIAKGVVSPTIGCASKYGVPFANPAPSQSALSSACRRVEVARNGKPLPPLLQSFRFQSGFGFGADCFQTLAHLGRDCSVLRASGDPLQKCEPPFRRGSVQHQVLGYLVFVPQVAILRVGRVELPATLRLVEPRLQTLALPPWICAT